MNLVLNYSERRQSQLETIDRIDTILGGAPCENTIISYLIWTRKLNKTQFDRFNKTSFWKKPDVLEEDLTMIDKHLTDIETRINNGDNPCDFLPQYFS